ncbi:MAG TPA: hypothetical protein VJ227_04320 [Patescibacteria group bacterium]|nr:hypothetical protein [Patescibacteria group bacterium]
MKKERLEGEAKPFTYLEREANSELLERVRASAREALKILNLTPDSTADEARRVAISLRLKFRNHNSGINAHQFVALQYVLDRTGDAAQLEDFYGFLVGGKDLGPAKTSK